ncbi:hypothetical protein LTR10_012603 [Elasticomyces elasticus]|uniref:Clr5 domain-containing protein n=1 Tax=Exophiala sideris TaxID=1016849 RepID=A0ABR0JRK8_9EURO|nr:hypothetical protein LTR10_012603 [Elasticomyces elasticus]KAK5040196.1 hypothetical protein LTS07_000693 [Exophiala sideris]KAK5043378.1 hypothetical protein LTR13_001149 [Exophiala sideris]KAK5068574.1 hypothetical protein LTR69_000694 [Exophiala sideris]KAK5186172.1 hypothetical protein LTR44_001227 [Eurotiomycetes sp. CCFEE 6388]
MTNPILAPRPSEPVACIATKTPPVPTHSDSEWAALYSEIERLYIRERRKLRYVMEYMERKYDFEATKQMYKKRFTRWGFQKNHKRSAASSCASKTQGDRRRVASRKASPTEELGLVPPSPNLSHDDTLSLRFLSRVRIWSIAFFESVQFRDEFQASQQPKLLQLSADPLRSSKGKEISFAFKLVMDLLHRGNGDLAGRMARKAFLLAEDMWQVEGPALMWNLLEMMHYMVTFRHVQLFHMLLAHLIALADGQMPETHPFPTMLRDLWGLVASQTRTASTPRGSPSSSSSFWSPSSAGNVSTPCGNTSVPGLLLDTLPSLLERAWILNAKTLFDHFDPRLILLYCDVIYDSCSIPPPSDIASVAGQWVSQVEAQPLLSVTAVSHHAQGLLASTSVEEEKMIQCLLTPRMDAAPPQDYKMLRERSLAALWERGNSILSKEAGIDGDSRMLLSMLAGMITAKILEGLSLATELTAKWPRIHAGHLACALKVLIDLDTEHGNGLQSPNLDTIERIRAMVALRGYADGEMAPQVVRDIFLLQDALTVAGKYGEAQEVEQDAYHRINQYMQDVPVAFA